ncbi:MAG TPA: hypothetical protein VMW32_09950 [Bacteroidales bacterium]|nr:hypothetical protein [Bacteroidales bacterium]
MCGLEMEETGACMINDELYSIRSILSELLLKELAASGSIVPSHQIPSEFDSTTVTLTRAQNRSPPLR